MDMSAHVEALLIMDAQDAIIARLGDHRAALLATLENSRAMARAAGVPVIFVRVAFRPGFPEVSPRNHIFSALTRTPTGASPWVENDARSRIVSSLAPREDDPVVTKKRVSAFTGSDLEVLLRSRSIDSLVLTGVATSGVVLSTLCQAVDMDYRVTVLQDGCADPDPEVHRVLMDRVFPRRAMVKSADEWGAGLTIRAASAEDLGTSAPPG